MMDESFWTSGLQTEGSNSQWIHFLLIDGFVLFQYEQSETTKHTNTLNVWNNVRLYRKLLLQISRVLLPKQSFGYKPAELQSNNDQEINYSFYMI